MDCEMSGQDQRKRTLEALERRFAVAKAELLQQQDNNKKLFHKARKVMHNTSSSSIAPLSHLTGASASPLLNTSSRKGNFSFFSRTASQDVEADAPAYCKLSHSVHENLLTTNAKISSGKGSTVNSVLHELFQNGDSAQKYMQGSRHMKIDNWILLDKVVQRRGLSNGARIGDLPNHSKRSKKHWSMKQHKKFGSFDLPQELCKFDIFKPMHEMWKDYIMQLVRNAGKNQLAQCLLNADLHGAIILVVDCKISSFKRTGGIMIRETTETFGIVTKEDKFRVVPKKVSVFMFQVDCWKITLHGDKLTSRNLGLA